MYTFLQLGKLHLCILRFSSRAASSRSCESASARVPPEAAAFSAIAVVADVGVNEMRRGMILPFFEVVTRMIVLRGWPLGPVAEATRTRPAGNARSVVVVVAAAVRAPVVKAVVCSGVDVSSCWGEDEERVAADTTCIGDGDEPLRLLLPPLDASGDDGGVSVWKEMVGVVVWLVVMAATDWPIDRWLGC